MNMRHGLTTQGGSGCGGGCGCRSSQGWRSGPPQCYCYGAISHIATHCPESLEDAQ